MRRLALAACLAPLACASGRAAIGGPPEEAYGAALEHWTASGQIYSKSDFVDRVVDLWATFQSQPFREARVRRWAEIAGLQPAEVDGLLAQERAEGQAELDFFAAMEVDPSRDNDLDQVHSVWHVTLETPDGRAVPPLSVRSFDPPNVNQRKLYPYVRDYWIGYWLRFPAVDGTGKPLLPEGATHVTLHLGSALGRLDLTYALPPGP
ncbi:MAG: hypothetical protein ACYDCL_03855 [Myxococcales bacterium]